MMSPKNQKPDIHELRKFGLMFAVILAFLFGFLIPLIRYGTMISEWPLWPWAIALLMVSWALVHPKSLGLAHTPWMKFAGVAQWVNTRIIMFLIFYLVILPIGLVLRLFGKDAMRRRFDDDSDSYRVKPDEQDKTHMEKPY